jgi:transcriptional regulator with GAF, ATPase, and Fis domain
MDSDRVRCAAFEGLTGDVNHWRPVIAQPRRLFRRGWHREHFEEPIIFAWWCRQANEPQSRIVALDQTSSERKRIEAALAQSSGKVSGANGAAARLGIPASTLESRIRSLRINKFQFKGV